MWSIISQATTYCGVYIFIDIRYINILMLLYKEKSKKWQKLSKRTKKSTKKSKK